jgi:hypothetical protein
MPRQSRAGQRARAIPASRARTVLERRVLRHSGDSGGAAGALAGGAGRPLLLPQVEEGGRSPNAHSNSSANGDVPAAPAGAAGRLAGGGRRRRRQAGRQVDSRRSLGMADTMLRVYRAVRPSPGSHWDTRGSSRRRAISNCAATCDDRPTKPAMKPRTVVETRLKANLPSSAVYSAHIHLPAAACCGRARALCLSMELRSPRQSHPFQVSQQCSRCQPAPLVPWPCRPPAGPPAPGLWPCRLWCGHRHNTQRIPAVGRRCWGSPAC